MPRVKNSKAASASRREDDARTVLYISYSAKAQRPGKGLHESGGAELDLPLNFRSVLSNFWKADLAYRGWTYGTLEHAFQAQKFLGVDDATFRSFALDSGSALSRSDGLAARKARKAKVLSKAQIDAWDARKDRVMDELWEAKFARGTPLGDLLVATGDAVLMHAAPRIKAVRWVGLEEVREMIR